MSQETMSERGQPRLHVARAKYLTAYVLLSCATAQLAQLAVTRGAYKRTRRSIVRAAALVILVSGMLGLATPRTSHATPIFAAPVTNAFGTTGFFPGVRTSPALADVDGDGDLDMFVGGFVDVPATSKYSGTLFLENTGTASAPAFTYIGVNPFGLVPSTLAGNYAGSFFHGGPALVDIDGDNDLEFFTQNALAGTDFFLNTGTVNVPTFTGSALPTGFAGSGLGDADAFVDIDGDGDLDRFFGVDSGTPYIGFQENIGTAALANFDVTQVDPFGLSAPDSHPSPAFVDVDGDGDLDVFMGKYDGELNFQLNTGTNVAPAFGLSALAGFGFTAPPGYTSKPAFGDIDDDGDVDLFVGTTSSAVYFYENTEINCGDGILDPSEVCDGLALDSETCVTLGYDSGTLACASDCLSFVTTACVGVPCPPTPSGTCLVPGKSQFQVKASGDPSKQQLKFKWQKGATFSQAMLGNPTTTTDTALCIYDRTAGVPALVGRVGVPANAFWVDKDPKGFQLVDKTGTYDGTTKVQLKTGDPGKTSASLQAKGANLTLPPPISGTEYFDQDTAVTVQLVSEAGTCWSSDFAAAGTSKNDGVQFKAK